jgi:aconitate hydratase
MKPGNNSFDTLSRLEVDGKNYHYFSLSKLATGDFHTIQQLPFSLKILLENVLRFEQGGEDAVGDIRAFAQWPETRSSQREIGFRPTRVLMQLWLIWPPCAMRLVTILSESIHRFQSTWL